MLTDSFGALIGIQAILFLHNCLGYYGIYSFPNTHTAPNLCAALIMFLLAANLEFVFMLLKCLLSNFYSSNSLFSSV